MSEIIRQAKERFFGGQNQILFSEAYKASDINKVCTDYRDKHQRVFDLQEEVIERDVPMSKAIVTAIVRIDNEALRIALTDLASFFTPVHQIFSHRDKILEAEENRDSAAEKLRKKLGLSEGENIDNASYRYQSQSQKAMTRIENVRQGHIDFVKDLEVMEEKGIDVDGIVNENGAVTSYFESFDEYVSSIEGVTSENLIDAGVDAVSSDFESLDSFSIYFDAQSEELDRAKENANKAAEQATRATSMLENTISNPGNPGNPGIKPQC